MTEKPRLVPDGSSNGNLVSRPAGNVEFIGIGAALSHIRFMPGRPRHSPQETVSASPGLGPFLCL